MEAVIVLFLFIALITLSIWFIPTVIAYKRDHLNKLIILIVSLLGLVLAVVPLLAFILWATLLVWSMYKSKNVTPIEAKVAEVKGPQGYIGPKGESAYETYVRLAKEDKHEYVLTEREWINSLRGKDADELPISKAGVVKQR